MVDLPPIVVELKAKAGEFLAAMGEVDKKIAKTATEGEANMKRLNAAASAVALGLGGAFAIIGKQSVEAADKFENAHVRLQTAIKNSGSSLDQWSKQIGTADQKMAALGFTHTETEQALGTLVTATGSVSKALGEMGTAADLARYKHESLDDASMTLNKAMMGNARALKDLGINMAVPVMTAQKLQKAQEALTVAEQNYQIALAKTQDKHKITQEDVDKLRVAKEKLNYQESQLNQAMDAQGKLLDLINQKVGGQATAYAQTFSGKVQILKTDFDNLEISIGQHLVPILDTLVTDTESVINWFEKHKTVAEALAIALGTTLALAIGVKLVGAVNAVINAGKDIATAFDWALTKVGVFSATAETEIETVGATATTTATQAEVAFQQAMASATVSAEEFSTAADGYFASIAATATSEAAATESAWVSAFSVIGSGLAGIAAAVPVLMTVNQLTHGSVTAAFTGHPGTAADDVMRTFGIGQGPDLTPLGAGIASAMESPTVNPASAQALTNSIGAAYQAQQLTNLANKLKNPMASLPNVPVTAGGGGSTRTRRGRSAPQIDAFAQALAGFANVVGGENIGAPANLGVANREVGIDAAILRHAELYEKQGQSLAKAAKGAQNKARALNDLHRSQSLVNTALRNLHTAESQQKVLQDQAIKDAIALANAKLEAGANVADPVAMARLKVQEAQNTLTGDKAGSLAYFQDLYALHVAENDLKNAIDQNTQATNVNTQAMQPFVGQVPSYLAVRAGANAGAYLGGSAGGSGSVTVNVYTATGSIPDATINAIVTGINARQRRNGQPLLAS